MTATSIHQPHSGRSDDIGDGRFEKHVETFELLHRRLVKSLHDPDCLPTLLRLRLLEGLSFVGHYHGCLKAWCRPTTRMPSADTMHLSRFRTRLFVSCCTSELAVTATPFARAFCDDVVVLCDAIADMDDEFVGMMMARSLVSYPSLFTEVNDDPGPESSAL